MTEYSRSDFTAHLFFFAAGHVWFHIFAFFPLVLCRMNTKTIAKPDLLLRPLQTQFMNHVFFVRGHDADRF